MKCSWFCTQLARHSRALLFRCGTMMKRSSLRRICRYYAALSASNRRMSSGSRSIANNNARAGASGVLRCCSQSRKVVMGRWKAPANSACVIPRRCRSTLTRDTRRILASCSGVRGCASGSDSAAATTSSSVMASRRAQSVSPRGRGSPGFTVTRVVPVLLMSCSLPGRCDSADVLIAQRHDDE